MTRFETQSITHLRAWPLDDGSGYRVSFDSPHVGCYHQAYVNGHWADCTDTPDERQFVIDALAGPVHMAIAAVDAADRFVDGATHLPAEATTTNWQVDLSVLRRIEHHAEETWSLMVTAPDQTASVATTMPAWPAWAQRWALGEDAMGLGGFGWDGHYGPGIGLGHFGRGRLGFGVRSATLSASLATEGPHVCFVRTSDSAGNQRDSDSVALTATPPPPSPDALTIIAYDETQHTLTVAIESETP
jgi:hypothetical protein